MHSTCGGKDRGLRRWRGGERVCTVCGCGDDTDKFPRTPAKVSHRYQAGIEAVSPEYRADTNRKVHMAFHLTRDGI